MGSFALTCAVSDLPIHAGTPVRFMLLSQNPYEDSVRCCAHSTWVPRTFPLRALYNDYGSVENTQEGPERDLWMDGFQHDLIEVGFGDNSCHDVPATKDMGFGRLLDALWERRVRVRRGGQGPQAVPDGYPTLQSVSTVFRGAGYTVNTPGRSGDTAFLVDERHHGSVRVRWANHGDEKGHTDALQRAIGVLPMYGTEIIPGTGSYAFNVELKVSPLEGVETPAPRSPGLLIESAMIREDVWQALLKQPIKQGWTDKRATLQEYTNHAFVYWNQTIEHAERRLVLEQETCTLKGPRALMMDRVEFDNKLDRENPIAGWLSREPVPFGFGLTAHWRLMAMRHVTEAIADDEVTSFLRTVAETAWVSNALGYVRYWWRPSYSVGPQIGEWAKHARVLKSFADIAKGEARNERNNR